MTGLEKGLYKSRLNLTVKTKSDRLLSLEKKFELSINSFRPFEDKPKIAIAVSGGQIAWL